MKPPPNNEQFIKDLGQGSWPEIISYVSSGEAVDLKLRVPDTLIEFAGHFPEHPVVPGVLQIHWAARLAQQCFSALEGKHLTTETFLGMQGIKFNGMVMPGAEINLSLSYSPVDHRLKFAFFDDEQKFSNGVLRYSADVQ